MQSEFDTLKKYGRASSDGRVRPYPGQHVIDVTDQTLTHSMVTAAYYMVIPTADDPAYTAGGSKYSELTETNGNI